MTSSHAVLAVPASLWREPALLSVLAQRDIGSLFRRVQQVTGASQSRIGALVGLSQAQVSEVISGKRKVTSVDVYARIVTGLGITDPARTCLFLGREVTTLTPETVSLSAYADVTAIYPSRISFASAVRVQDLLSGARTVRACGLSLNLICQHYSDTDLLRIASETKLQLLLLDPRGEAIRAREQEECQRSGTLSNLNELNLDVLAGITRRLPSSAAANLEVGLYDETIRFNLIFIDERTCIAQPYLPTARGVDSPTFVVERRGATGLYPTFERVFDSLWQKRKPL